jgi:Rrf2 family protein
MARSTKLASAAYIMSFVASRDPGQVTTDAIAESLHDHPARVRQLVATLVKAKLLKSLRGANGGVVLGRPASTISLRDVYEAVEEQPMLSLWLRDGFEGWGRECLVQPRLSELYSGMEHDLLDRLADVSISALYKRRGKRQ